MPVAAGEITLMGQSSIPFERPLPPLVDKSDGENCKEHHHRPEAEQADLAECYCPREQEGHFQVENDEKNRDEVEAHVEFHAGIIKRIEPAFVRGQLLRIGLLE